MSQTPTLPPDAVSPRPPQVGVDPLLAGVMADVAILSGADAIMLVQPPADDRPGRVVAAGPERVAEWTDHPAADGLHELERELGGGELAVIDGATLDSLREWFEMLPGDVRTAICARLEAGGEQVGLAVLGFRTAKRPDARSRRSLLAAARQLAMALRQQRLADSLREQAEEWRVLLELAQLSTSTLRLDELLDRYIARAVELTSADKGSIWLLSPDGEQLVPAALVGMPPEFVTGWKRQRFALADQPLSAEALRSRTPIAIPDAASDPRTDKEALELFGERALLVVPILAAGEALGTLFLNNVSRRERHPPREVEIAQSIASQVGAAIRLAQLFEASERGRRDLQSAFGQFGEVLAASLDPAAALHALADLAVQMMKASMCVIYRAQGDEIEIAALVGPAKPDAPRAVAPDDPVASAVAGGEALHFPDASVVAGQVTLPEDAAQQRHAYLVVPLRAGDSVVGALAMARAVAPFTQDEIDVLVTFGRGAAVALQRGEILEALERRVVELSGLQQLSQAITSLSSIENTLENVVGGVTALTQAKRCVVLLFDQESGRLEGQNPAAGLPAKTVARMAFGPETDSASMRALFDGETFVSNEPVSAGGQAEPGTAASADRNILIAPMRAGDEPIGVIRVSNKPGGFTDDDVRLLSIFAGQAAVVIQNVMLFQAEARERDQLEAIFVNASDGIIIADAEARVVRMNPAAEQITGWAQDAARGRSVSEVMPLRGRDGRSLETTHPLRWVQDQRSAIAYSEQTIETRDGRLVDIAASYAHIPGAAGEGGLGVGILRDLSAAKEVERMKSDFVSFVSHELRTPLSLIKGYASTLLRPGLSLNPETQQRFLQGISDASDRLALIVNNLLNASRIESGLFLPRLTVVDLREVVKPVVEEMQAQAVGRLSLLWDAGDTYVRVDPEQLQLVVSNIIGNAIRYAIPHGDGPILVAARRSRDGVQLDFTDNGPGIPSEDLPNIFEKFYRGSAEDRPGVPGSGLGLYISRSIVEAHGGRIWADSTPGEGATVGFWLPIQPTESQSVDAEGVPSQS